MKRFNFTKKRVLTVLSIAGVLAVAGIAYAFWTTSGTGSGTAATGTSSDVTFKDVSSPTGLYPGGDAQALDFTINNPASGKQFVHNVTISIASIKDSDGNDAVGCSSSDFTITQPTSPSDTELTSGDHVFSPSGASIAMNDDPANNQDGCKNVTVNLSYHANAS